MSYRYLYVAGGAPDELEQSVNNLAAEGFEPVGPVSYVPATFYRERLDAPLKEWPMATGSLLQLMRKGGGP